MGETSTGEVCRLVVVGPTSRVDLSVPVHVPLTDLMPALLRSLGADLADRGLEHSGWVLQRLGQAPLEEDSTTADLGLVDGDVLHLRPRSEQIPPLDFDDLVDGIATGIRARSGLWDTATTRFVALCSLALWIAVAVCVLVLPGGEQWQRVTLMGAFAMILLGGSLLALQALQDVPAARLIVAGGVALGGQAAVVAGSGLGPADGAGGMSLLLAAVTCALLGSLAVVLVAAESDPAPGVVAVLLTSAGAAVAAGLRLSGMEWDQVATAALVLTIALRPTVPLIAFKLSGMALPPLPVEPSDLQTDIEPEPGQQVLERTAAADRQMTALCLAYGIISGAALVTMGLSGRFLVLLAAVLGALAQLLSLRPMTSTWHRLALGLPAVAGVSTVMIAIAGRSGPGTRTVILGIALVLAVAATTAAHTLPRRRLTPLWGRVGDWVQSLSVIVVMALALGIWSLFELLRRTVG